MILDDVCIHVQMYMYLNVLVFSYESTPTVPLQDDGFETYKVLELVHGSHDAERIALGKHRLMNLLAPHTRVSAC